VHAALADPARLLITDMLLAGDASPSELAALLAMPSNLLAHHLHVLEQAGVITRRRSEGDRRRTYLQLIPATLDSLAAPPARAARRVLFVCTANSARSHLAAALWRRASSVPAVSAGTHPAARIDPGAIAAARRHRLPLPRLRPRHISDVQDDGDLMVTVCDLAREELSRQAAVHWSVPDPVPGGDPASFDAAVTELSHRVERLAPRLAALSLLRLPARGRQAPGGTWEPGQDPPRRASSAGKPGQQLPANYAGHPATGLIARMIAECRPGAASVVNVTVASANPAAVSPSRYSLRDSAPAMHPT
jgi:ArsR family transcriptional regulator, arsenate/arsenite/antimonite-responsive transcriptional repressor / arsenate reductase (thioredoxin)